MTRTATHRGSGEVSVDQNLFVPTHPSADTDSHVLTRGCGERGMPEKTGEAGWNTRKQAEGATAYFPPRV
jgi:hypothetical protein